MIDTTVGSLCSGYGGLELAIREVFGAEPAWLSELPEIQDNPKSKPRRNPCLDVLGARYPGVTLLGDLDLIDWGMIARTSIYAAGFPCQPASAAGKQLGDADPRWKWPGVRAGIAAHLPPLVVLENVANLVSGFKGRLWQGILDDLRAIGYAVVWGIFDACLEEVGGCHHRHRVFLLARRVEARNVPAARRWGGKTCGTGRTVDVLPTPSAVSYGNNRGGGMGRVGPVRYSLEQLSRIAPPVGFGPLLPTPRATDGTKGEPNQRGSSGDLAMPSAVQPQNFGRYAWAVERWTDRWAAPPLPTEIGPKGGIRMASAFPEWMMGLPEGWVTDLLPRSDALRLIGNGVFPRQAVSALRHLVAMFADDIREHRAARAARPTAAAARALAGVAA